MRAGFGCPWRSISASACRYPGGSALSSRNTRLCVSWSLLWYVAEPVLSYEATVDAVFPAPDPGAFQRKSPPGGDCVGIPAADKGKRTRARAEPFGGIARERAAQVAREDRPLPNGENAGFGPGLADHGRNVPRGEYLRARPRLQRIAHRDKAARVSGESALRDPWRRVRSGCPHRGLRLEAFAAFELEPVFARGKDLSAGAHRDAALTENTHDAAARAVAGEDGQLAEQRELRAGSGKSVPHGEQHLDPGRAAAYHGDAPHLAPPRRFAQPFPAREKRLDRAHAKRVFCGGGRLA